MHPILTRTEYGFIYTYTVVLALGILAGAALVAWRLKQAHIAPLRWFDGLLVTLGAALIGGRAAFVSANWVYFSQNQHEIWQLLKGGYGYHGALIGGLSTFWLWNRRDALPFDRAADYVAAALVLVHAAGWLACLFDGCAYGQETFIAWYAADLPDSYGVYAVRYRTQLAGFMTCLLLFLLVLPWQPAPAGRRFGWALCGLSLIHLALTLWRGDPMPELAGWRLDTLLAAVMAVSAAVIALSRRDYAT